MDYQELLESRGIDTYNVAGEFDFLINCPFHDDESPSLEVHRTKGVFYCFGCKESGPFEKLLAEIENISILDAKKILMKVDSADSVIDDIQNMFSSIIEDEAKKIKYFSIDAFHKKYKKLQYAKLGFEYVLDRGIVEEEINWFDLRWSGAEGKWKYRVIIPIYNENGKLLTYAGRVINNKIKPKTRKIKGRSPRSTLYGLYNICSMRGYSKLPYLIVTEGEFDAMYLQQFGLYAVSTMGTMGLSGEQVFLLKKHCKTTIFSYDGDPAGRSAQKKGIEKMRRYMPTEGINLPDKYDPNELTPKMVSKIYRRFLLCS